MSKVDKEIIKIVRELQVLTKKRDGFQQQASMQLQSLNKRIADLDMRLDTLLKVSETEVLKES